MNTIRGLLESGLASREELNVDEAPACHRALLRATEAIRAQLGRGPSVLDLGNDTFNDTFDSFYRAGWDLTTVGLRPRQAVFGTIHCVGDLTDEATWQGLAGPYDLITTRFFFSVTDPVATAPQLASRFGGYETLFNNQDYASFVRWIFKKVTERLNDQGAFLLHPGHSYVKRDGRLVLLRGAYSFVDVGTQSV